MADLIEILSPSALKDLTTANNEVVKLISNINSAGQAMQSIKTPSGSDSAVKNLSNNLIAQEKNIQKVQQALEKARIEEIKLQQAREKAFDKYDAQLAKEQAKLNTSLGVYSKVQQKLNTLSNEYRNLAVKKELSGKLTDAEAKRYDYLSSRITKYDTTLKAVDASMGKYQRNVGNYAGAFNPLSNSINQLTREMPAFANSVQTGFMAISNNLPIFFDAMGQAIAQQKELQAQGKPSQNALQLLAGSFFTLGTALSVGVTLLTVYGAQIFESISGSKQRKIALENEKKALEEKAKAEDEARGKLARYQSEEISRARILLENAKNLDLPYTTRLKAIKELQERYPDYLGNLSKEKILAGDTADAEIRLNDALVKRGIALASQQAIQEEINNGLKTEKWLADQLNDIQTKRISLGKQLSALDPFSKDENVKERYDELNLQLSRLFYLEGTLKEQYESKNNVIKKSIDFYIKQYNENAKYLDVVKEDTKVTEKNTEAKKDNNKELERKGEFLSKAYLENQISKLQKELSLISKLNPNYQLFNITLEQTKGLYDALYGDGKIKKGQEEVIKGVELTEEAVYEEYFAWLKLKDATDEYIKSITSDAFNKAFENIGLASAKMFLDFDENGKSTFDKLIEGADKSTNRMSERFAVSFQAIGDVAQEVIGMMQNLENQRSEQQLANLEKEYQTALLFAGESTVAREELERQYDERRKVIQRRQAQQQKQLAIFNILVNTAQGVVSALASTPPNIPLSIAIGAIGALQAGIVASQQLPQFYKGTENAPEGWAWTQEKGAEIITDKSGKIKTLGSDKGAQMTYLNKGDKVLTATDTESILFNNELNGILTNNGISSAPTVIVNGGLSKEDFNSGISKLSKTINEKEALSIIRDKRGERVYRERQNKRTELLNIILKAGRYDV